MAILKRIKIKITLLYDQEYTSGDSNLRRSQAPERINSTVYAETPHDRIHPRNHRNSENSKTTKTTRIIRRRELIHKRTINDTLNIIIDAVYNHPDLPPPSFSQDILRDLL